MATTKAVSKETTETCRIIRETCVREYGTGRLGEALIGLPARVWCSLARYKRPGLEGDVLYRATDSAALMYAELVCLALKDER